jgi:hypothetical protein
VDGLGPLNIKLADALCIEVQSLGSDPPRAAYMGAHVLNGHLSYV